MEEIRKIVREIVSNEIERMSGGASDVQKNQSGYGYLGNQSDAPKQERKNSKHIYFNAVTTPVEGGGDGAGSETVEESEDIMEEDDFVKDSEKNN